MDAGERDDEFEAWLAVAAERTRSLPIDEGAEAAYDEAFDQVRRDTEAGIRLALRDLTDQQWAALLNEVVSPQLCTVGAFISALARFRLRALNVAEAMQLVEESVIQQFVDAVDEGNHDPEAGAVLGRLLDEGSAEGRLDASLNRLIRQAATAIDEIRSLSLDTPRRRQLGFAMNSLAIRMLLDS